MAAIATTIMAIEPIPRFLPCVASLNCSSPLAGAPAREALAETPADERKGQALG